MRATLKDVTLEYTMSGDPDGEPVLLVPGLHQAQLFEQMQTPFLVKAGYRVVTYDHRGVAPSEVTPPPYTMEGLADDCAALIEHVGIPGCAIVGYSLGAMVILELLMTRPELVSKAALVGVPWKPSLLQRAIRRETVDRVRAGEPLPALLEGVYRAMYLFGPRALNRDAFIGPYLEGLQGLGESGGHGEVGHAEASISYEPAAEEVAKIDTDCLIVGMEHDIVAPYHLSRELAALVPSARYVQIRNCGHAALLEKPTELNRILVDYFQGRLDRAERLTPDAVIEPVDAEAPA